MLLRHRIESEMMLRLVFGRPWRQTEGLLNPAAPLLSLAIDVPDHTMPSRHATLGRCSEPNP
jgi:hypothetical protein